MPKIPRLAREPLVHFMLIGAAVFALHSAVSEPAAVAAADEIVVTPEVARQLADRFRGVWMRPPAPGELDALIDEYVREEVLVRQALEFSMDDDDAVIRQRLAQKMQFLLESAASATAPSENDLRAYLDANEAAYERGTRIGFEQVFLGEAPSEAAVDAALAALADGTEPARVGQRTLLPATTPVSAGRPVDATFGSGFFAQLAELEPGEWAGPVSSGYGAHLVRVTGHEPGGLPDFADIREQVEADWTRQQTARIVDQQYARMRDAYKIVRPGDAELAGIVR